GDRHHPVNGRVPDNIRRIMSQRSQREREFVQVRGFLKQRADEISASHVVGQVAEKLAPERVIPEILDQAAPVGVSVGFAQVLLGRLRKVSQQQRPDLVLPQYVDNLLVGEQ